MIRVGEPVRHVCQSVSREDRPRTIHPALVAQKEKTVLPPHLGSAVDDIRREIALEAARNIIQVIDGHTPPRGCQPDQCSDGALTLDAVRRALRQGSEKKGLPSGNLDVIFL